MNWRKVASYAGTAAVAGIAAYASYLHMRELALHAGQPVSIANVLPLSVDGLVLVSSVALIDGRERRTSAWCAFILGVSASIVANILAAGPTLVDPSVSAWPSVALLVTIEVIARGGRRRVVRDVNGDNLHQPARSDVKADISSSPRPSRKAPPSVTAASKVAKAAAKLPAGSPAEIAALAKVSESTARRHLASTNTPAPAETNGFDVLAEATR
jgi:hypothetical protein